jgi:hypothetical protein
MKKFILIILSFLFLSCSSDNNEDAKEGNFLDVYNGVIWKGDMDFGGEWFVFTPKGLNTYIIENGCNNSSTVEFGVADIETGHTITVLENSKDFLKLQDLDGNQTTCTVLENGDVLRLESKLINLNLNKVSELCK